MLNIIKTDTSVVTRYETMVLQRIVNSLPLGKQHMLRLVESPLQVKFNSIKKTLQDIINKNSIRFRLCKKHHAIIRDAFQKLNILITFPQKKKQVAKYKAIHEDHNHFTGWNFTER